MKAPSIPPAAVAAILRPWSHYGQPLYRRVLQHLDLDEGAEVVVIGCGTGEAVVWLVQRTGVHIEGVDPDDEAIAGAEAGAREAGVTPRPTFQAAGAADLPYEEGVFTAAIVDLVALGGEAGGDALHEASRVLRPMGSLFCLAPVWVAEPHPSHRLRISDDLELVPRYVMEWKQLLREAGLVELAVEDIGGEGQWLETSVLTATFRGWRVAGWRGVRLALSEAYASLRAAAVSRTLGLSLIWGSKWPHSG